MLGYSGGSKLLGSHTGVCAGAGGMCVCVYTSACEVVGKEGGELYI